MRLGCCCLGHGHGLGDRELSATWWVVDGRCAVECLFAVRTEMVCQSALSRGRAEVAMVGWMEADAGWGCEMRSIVACC